MYNDYLMPQHFSTLQLMTPARAAPLQPLLFQQPQLLLPNFPKADCCITHRTNNHYIGLAADRRCAKCECRRYTCIN